MLTFPYSSAVARGALTTFVSFLISSGNPNISLAVTDVIPSIEQPKQSVAVTMPGLLNWRYDSAKDIPAEKIKKHEILHGKTVKVIDGDTIRIRHLPFYPFGGRSADFDGKLSENTISVRIYGVDAPEVAKFGNPSQPKGDEAKEFTQKMVGDKVVRVKLLRKDQYGRIVGKVQTGGVIPFTKRDLTKELAKNGYGVLYTGGGAEYDNKRDELVKLIDKAKKKKKGIWIDGPNVQTPAEYKRAAKNTRSDR